MALTSKLVLVDLQVNKIPLRSAFSMKTCWHCWVSSLHLTSSPFYFSIHTLPHKASTASVHQVLGCIHRSCPSALALTCHCGCHIAMNEEHRAQTIWGQSYSFLFLCPMRHVLPLPPRCWMAFHILLPTVQPFSHTAPDFSMYFLASDCWLTLSQPHWGCDSDLLLVARTHILMNIWKEYFRHYNFDHGSNGIIIAPTKASLFTVCIQHWVVAKVRMKGMKQRYHKAPCLCLMTCLL